MSEHTPEPWEADGKVIFADVGIQPHIAHLHDLTNTPEANARRIVACVNACVGMADPAAEIAKLRAERDKLMAALTRLASPYSFTAFGLGRWYDDESLARMIYARAALAEKT